ncbi:Orexin receptor type 2 [Myotis davidii]|uniref:Orexin receptor type 2 n=1 Tax=Myotis davidii TaxID=225400 RepID=L5M918_MYODS|nr:Orexin receptor type 2 [Myotis davidii]
MSGTKLEGSPPCRNWSSASELNETQEPFLSPTDYDDEEFLRYLWREYLHPKEYEWVLIAGYIIVFVVALIGNILVCVAVWKNHHMRTVTNYFIVNLSLADVLVTITCLPATLVVDITETWFFGNSLCKVIPYLQTVSVSVSVLTLSCIALDRWYAICHPLMFKSTAKRARNSIIIIWIVSCIIMIPQAIVMECRAMLPGLANKTTLFTVCEERWAGEIYPKMYHICFFLVTYMAPLCLMVLAYLQIFRKLWCRQIPGTSSVVQRKWKPLQPVSQPRGSGQQTKSRISAVAAEIKQIRARRKTARMLMVVLLVFAICYLPISILNVLKRVFGMFTHAEDRETVYAWFTFSHWLVYANSAVNPIIYNFLSGPVHEFYVTGLQDQAKTISPTSPEGSQIARRHRPGQGTPPLHDRGPYGTQEFGQPGRDHRRDPEAVGAGEASRHPGPQWLLSSPQLVTKEDPKALAVALHWDIKEMETVQQACGQELSLRLQQIQS